MEAPELVLEVSHQRERIVEELKQVGRRALFVRYTNICIYVYIYIYILLLFIKYKHILTEGVSIVLKKSVKSEALNSCALTQTLASGWYLCRTVAAS